jgi:hypothetical protein
MTCGKCGNCGMACKSGKKGRMCIISFGLAWGITFALLMLFIGWLAWLTGHGFEMIRTTSSLYHGFAGTFVGGLVGALWGLIEGFILGALIALFYNLFTCCCHMSCCQGRTCQCGNKGTGTCNCNCEGCRCGNASTGK